MSHVDACVDLLNEGSWERWSTFVTVNAGLRLPIVSNIVLLLAARCGSVCTA